ncbi:DUF6252 family protein [Zunongwangia atlantica]|uniref:Lipoprotein n=1 Tax=Zunongwangia atlantica 22II14-10F7 TaxID=1185767 RepID=A0A1Y1T8J6_9FLAO|nr:DUF6252 family protein [Zunongwangia atlantica]ORL47032.1 hypothetical protein IIF7_03411 [Zunongwangia atlantica 22II14-10F7]
MAQQNILLKSVTKLMLIFSIIFLVACSKDDDGGDGGTAADGTVVAKVDGDDFQSFKEGTTAAKATGNAGTTLTILGTDASGFAINLIINGYEGVGTYDIGGENLVYVTATYVEVDINNPMNSKTFGAPYGEGELAGEISVSEDENGHLKGTFYFEASDDQKSAFRNVTDGSFNVQIQ